MDCHYKSGDVIEIYVGDELDPLRDPNCIIEQGVTIRFFITEPVAPVEDIADNSEEHKNRTLVDNNEVLKQTNNPKEVTKKMEPVKQEQEVKAAPQEAPQAIEAPAPVQAPVTTVATTTEAPAAPFDINQLVTSTGGGGTIAVILALIAVVGGTAGWKFWQKLSEQKHEQKMKELEIQAQSQGLNGTQPPPCQAANAAIEARLAGLEGKIATVEKKTSSFSAGFDADEIEDRLLKIEKKLKSTAGRPPKEQ
jgi:hypothetical protein